MSVVSLVVFGVSAIAPLIVALGSRWIHSPEARLMTMSAHPMSRIRLTYGADRRPNLGRLR
jgi:hypothetical protein